MLERAGEKCAALYKRVVADTHADDRHQMVRISRTYFRIFASVNDWAYAACIGLDPSRVAASYMKSYEAARPEQQRARFSK